jgi:hypothetical protein
VQSGKRLLWSIDYVGGLGNRHYYLGMKTPMLASRKPQFCAFDNPEVAEFLKRNRKNFGRDVAVRYFDRLNEADFQGCAVRDGQKLPVWAVMLTWCGSNMKPE